MTGPPPSFSCGEETAQLIAPLVRLLVEPVPEFLHPLSKTLDQAHYKKIKRFYGLFISGLYQSLGLPIWSQYPSLDPRPSDTAPRA